MEIIGLIVLCIGVGFCVVGVIGTIRMPDVYCRLHASGKVSTVGLCGLLLGTALIMPSAALKLLALALFALLTLPVSTHAMAAAAFRHGIPMYTQASQPSAAPLPDLQREAKEAFISS